MAAACKLVVGMNLQGEIAGGIDDLDEQRECVAESLVDVAAYEVGSVLLDHPGEGQAGIGSVDYNGLVASDA